MVRDGYKFALPPLVLGVAAAVSGMAHRRHFPAGAGLFVVYFFRDPERVPPAEPGVVVSPADGRVMEVVKESWDGRAGQRISIFLAVWNVHVNRSPMAGRVTRVDYRPGKFYAAMRSGRRWKMSRTSFTSKPRAARSSSSRSPAGLPAGWFAGSRPGDSLILGRAHGHDSFWIADGRLAARGRRNCGASGAARGRRREYTGAG